MLDKAKFKYFVATKNLTLSDLAVKMGMNPATLSKKLNGTTDFSRHEIQLFKDIVGLTESEMLSVFLLENLRKRKNGGDTWNLSL